MCVPDVLNTVAKVGMAALSGGMTLLAGGLGGGGSGSLQSASQPDPAAERAQAEAAATNEANMGLAAEKRARRANTLALGGPTGMMSAITSTAKTSVLGGGAPQ